MSNPLDYTVAWICTLEMDHAAALALLDETYPLPNVIHRAPRDTNLYTLGNVSTHNVVIATAPIRDGGAVSVATVWRDMLHSFPNLRVALVLSVAPDQKHDMRPGDLLVGSLPNPHISLSQHDNAIQKSPLLETGLGQPFASLRAAVCELQNKHKLNGHQLERSIQQTLQNWPQMHKGYSRPPASHLQKARSDSDGNTLHIDNPSRLVSRHTQEDESDNLTIHYRFSAPANQPIEDVQPGGEAATKSADLCFEMEAAERTDNFPCLLVRGICDAADSHKNGAWQGFAAMAAAAYAKDLLCQLPPDKIESQPQVDLQRLAVPGFGSKPDLHQSEPKCMPCESLERHQGSHVHVTDGKLETSHETSESISCSTASEYCASGSCSGTCESDPASVSQTKHQSSKNDCYYDAATQVAAPDTVPIAARPVVHCQRLHVDDTATSSFESRDADVIISQPNLATYGTSRLERERHRDAYINAIRKDDVFKLASSHNHDKECTEFRERENGSFHVCFFVEFPSDGQKWVVRFPICPVLYEPWQKLRSEVATMEYIQTNTTIPIPRVYGYGPGGDLDMNNATGLPYIILEYIVGQPFDPKRLLKASDDVVQKFYTQLGDALSQLRAQEFEYAGSVTKDARGFVIGSPRSVDLNSIQLQGRRGSVTPQTTAFDFAMCNYDTLAQRLSLPTEEMGEDDARHEIFALEDFKIRLFQLIDPSLNFEPFVLTHGDLRPSNIIVSEDFTIKGIIDWEWSTTIPRQFFMPPLWFSGYEVASPRDARYQFQYSIFYQALLRAGAASDACRTLALEWGPDLGSSYRLFLPEALLHHHALLHVYYLALFPEFFKGMRRQDKLEAFYRSSRVFREAVRVKVEESRKYKEHLIADGLLNPDIKRAQDLELEALRLKAAKLFGSGTAAP
ncbi:kinase-like domain [Cordyceps militaris]|uniref:Kinase-like domain n=1 Tax=Cordyceps militaris TaxID=73501 RepID=A0A2H4SIS6_CORMI|nr:kinase-like domain [Cordyceps militaris]